jgi:hypothetical protein
MGSILHSVFEKIQSLIKSLGDPDFQPQRLGSASSADRYEFFPYTNEAH